jgi:hypothetical protein
MRSTLDCQATGDHVVGRFTDHIATLLTVGLRGFVEQYGDQVTHAIVTAAAKKIVVLAAVINGAGGFAGAFCYDGQNRCKFWRVLQGNGAVAQALKPKAMATMSSRLRGRIDV